MICQAQSVQLINFIAILQLLAGLCLIFFYDDLLRTLVVTSARKKCSDNLDEIKNYMQDEIDEKARNGIYGVLACELDEKQFHTIPSLRNAISYSGKLAFTFLIALMAVASHETVGKNTPICYELLLVASFAFLFMVSRSLLHRKDTVYDRYWNFIISTVILWGIIILSVLLPCKTPFNRTCTTYGILAALPACMLIIILFFRFDERRAERLNKDLKRLCDAIASYRNWAVSPNNAGQYFKIDSTLRRLFPLDASLTEADKVVKDHINKSIHTLKETYSGYNLVLYDPCRRLKSRVRNDIAAPRFMSAKIVIILFAVIYMVEIVQLFRTLH